MADSPVLQFIAKNQNTIIVPQRELNEVWQNQYLNMLLPYQNFTGFFKPMLLTHDGKYKRSRVTTSKFSYQAHEQCGIPNNGKTNITSETFEPCAVDSGLVVCGDQWGTCFSHLNTWGANGTIEQMEQLQRIISVALTSELNARRNELWQIQMLSKFYHKIDPSLNVCAPVYEEKIGLERIIDVCDGILSRLVDSVETCGILPEDGFLTCNNENADLAGELFERVFCCAEQKGGLLGEMATSGLRATGASDTAPYFFGTANLLPLIRRAVQRQTEKSCSGSMGFWEKEAIQTGNGSTVEMYSYNGIRFFPLVGANAWDGFICKDGKFIKTVVLGLTTNNNIEVGNSAGSVLTSDGDSAGMMVYQDPNPMINKTYMGHRALIGNHIIDPSQVVWDYEVYV